LSARLRAEEQALGRLELAGEMVPSLDWFIYAFVRKEAVLSSQIEGTQATLVDLFEYEAEKDDRQPLEDLREVCNYLDALKYARGQLASPKGAAPVDAAPPPGASPADARRARSEQAAGRGAPEPELD